MQYGDIKVAVEGGTPFKGKLGVPVWFAGKVSPAFNDHLFWPSPPKKTAKKTAKEILPACCSTSKWRELYRDKKKPQAKVGKKKVSENGMQQKKVQARESSEPVLQPTDMEPDTGMDIETQKPAVLKKSTKRMKKKAKEAHLLKKRKATCSTSTTDDTKCSVCGIRYCDPPFDDWQQCHNWYHVGCLPDDTDVCYRCLA